MPDPRPEPDLRLLTHSAGEDPTLIDPYPVYDPDTTAPDTGWVHPPADPRWRRNLAAWLLAGLTAGLFGAALYTAVGPRPTVAVPTFDNPPAVVVPVPTLTVPPPPRTLPELAPLPPPRTRARPPPTTTPTTPSPPAPTTTTPPDPCAGPTPPPTCPPTPQGDPA